MKSKAKSASTWNMGADLRASQGWVAPLDVTLMAVDTSNAWMAGGMGALTGFDEAHHFLSEQGVSAEQVTTNLNAAFKQLSKAQAKHDHPDMSRFLLYMYADIRRSPEYLDAIAHGTVRGLWAYLCYLGADQTRVFRLVHVYEPGNSDVEMMPRPVVNALIRAVVAQDMLPGTQMAAAVRKVGGAILHSDYLPGA